MPQAPDVLADVLQDRGALGVFFVHYIAHFVGLRSILPGFRRIVRPPDLATQGSITMNTLRLMPQISKAEAVLILITMIWAARFLSSNTP
jgi:hypothetical protein